MRLQFMVVFEVSSQTLLLLVKGESFHHLKQKEKKKKKKLCKDTFLISMTILILFQGVKHM